MSAKRCNLILIALFAIAQLAKADSGGTTVTITQRSPLESLSAAGEVTGVSEATIGTHYLLVSCAGPNVTLKDSTGALYQVAVSSTDFTPSPQASPVVKPKVITQATATAATTSAHTPPPPVANPVVNPVNNLLQNGDFSDGSNNWLGDGKTPAEYAQDNLSAASDPLTSKGLIIQLKPDAWTKVTQVFSGDQSTKYVDTIVYKTSADLNLSSKPTDYVDLNAHVQINNFEGYAPISTRVGQVVDMIHEIGGSRIVYEMFAPKVGSSDAQTYVHHCPPLPDSGNKTFVFAIPPGNGIIVLLSASVTSN